MRLKRCLVGVLILTFVSCFSIKAFAESINSAKNLFVADGEVDKRLDIEGDAYIAGNGIKLSGNVAGDVIVAGNTLDIYVENVGGSVRLAGSTVNIGGNINRNITAIGATINIKEGTSANGVYVSAGEVEFLGEAEDVFISADKVNLNGIIYGNVNIECNELIIGENTKVDGEIKVKASTEPTILGEFDSDKIEFTLSKEYENKSDTYNRAFFIEKILSLITALILSLLLVLMCKRYLFKAKEYTIDRPWLPFLIGFATLIILPILALLVCITIIGIPIAFIALIIYGVLIYLAPVVSGIVLGEIIFKNMNLYLSALIGTIFIKVIMFIPYVGGVVLFACVLLSLGVFIQNLISSITSKEIM